MKRKSSLEASVRRAKTAMRGILDDHGFDRSAREGLAVDRSGAPLPMYTYPTIEFLGQLDWRERRVLEFGSGQSTLWWAHRAREIWAVEHDDDWVARLREFSLPNVTCIFAMRPHVATGEDYVGVVPSGERFDVVVLDGLHYYDCARRIRQFFAPAGLVIVDNADFYPATCRILREADFLQVDMAGFKPTHRDAQVTSLFFDRAFDVPPRYERQPVTCVGGKPSISPFDSSRTIRVQNGNVVIS
jgi:hypothetical protein